MSGQLRRPPNCMNFLRQATLLKRAGHGSPEEMFEAGEFDSFY